MNLLIGSHKQDIKNKIYSKELNVSVDVKSSYMSALCRRQLIFGEKMTVVLITVAIHKVKNLIIVHCRRFLLIITLSNRSDERFHFIV